MKRVAACFVLWPLMVALQFQFPVRDGRDGLAVRPSVTDRVVAGPVDLRVLPSGSRGASAAMRAPNPGEYSVYTALYAGGGRWSEFSAPGIAVSSDARVAKYVQRFRTTRRDDIEMWLRRAGGYLPMMRHVLVENGLPGELACLAMVESGFDPRAVSDAGAVGLWQFMPETARRYGLRVDEWVDERLDPERSTEAAARYLRDLYRKYESWDLAVAAYNAGERRINHILRRTGRRDFWRLARRGFFHRETRYHVIKFNAAVAIIRDLDGNGFAGVRLDPPIRTETIPVPAGTTLPRFAGIVHVPVETLLDLNPQLIRHRAPPAPAAWPLRVPCGAAGRVLDLAESGTLS